jgi:hypothetical protein
MRGIEKILLHWKKCDFWSTRSNVVANKPRLPVTDPVHIRERQEIDGLRAPAVVAVILFYAGVVCSLGVKF